MDLMKSEPEQDGCFWPRYQSGKACCVCDGFGLGLRERSQSRNKVEFQTLNDGSPSSKPRTMS